MEHELWNEIQNINIKLDQINARLDRNRQLLADNLTEEQENALNQIFGNIPNQEEQEEELDTENQNIKNMGERDEQIEKIRTEAKKKLQEIKVKR